MPSSGHTYDKRRAPRRRFGPSPFWYGMVVTTLVSSVASAWFLVATLDTDGDTDGALLFVALAATLGSVLLLLGTAAAWSVYEVHDNGLLRKRIGRRRFRVWSDLVDVGTRNLHTHTEYDDVTGSYVWIGGRGETDSTPFVFLVYGRDGLIAFRIPPWITHRSQLIREILRRTRPK